MYQSHESVALRPIWMSLYLYPSLPSSHGFLDKHSQCIPFFPTILWHIRHIVTSTFSLLFHYVDGRREFLSGLVLFSVKRLLSGWSKLSRVLWIIYLKTAWNRILVLAMWVWFTPSQHFTQYLPFFYSYASKWIFPAFYILCNVLFPFEVWDLKELNTINMSCVTQVTCLWSLPSCWNATCRT